jgi:hypothetical protein
MKTIEQLKQEKEDIERQIKELEEVEKLKDFQEFTYKSKKYRIYKWENKPFKDFVCPQGYRWINGLELIELINESNFDFEKYPVYYFSKKLFKNGYGDLFWACLGRCGDWDCSVNGLGISNGGGRVVCVECKK